MQAQKNIIDCYNKTAKKYADKFIDELAHKHFDKILLNAFAGENGVHTKLIDLGCGPGQTTQYLYQAGVTNILGTDISPEMVKLAKNIHPHINFETADILSLPYPDASFNAAVAFYAIVHFDYQQLKIAFTEINRILEIKGQFLFSFHVGDTVIHLDEFLDHPVNISFHFFDTSKVMELLAETGFEITDSIERAPYPAFEYHSQRAYIWATKTENTGMPSIHR